MSRSALSAAVCLGQVPHATESRWRVYQAGCPSRRACAERSSGSCAVHADTCRAQTRGSCTRCASAALAGVDYCAAMRFVVTVELTERVDDLERAEIVGLVHRAVTKIFDGKASLDEVASYVNSLPRAYVQRVQLTPDEVGWR